MSPRWLWLLLLGGCNNPCQQLCVEMADYADECGLTVSADDIKTCQENFKSAEQADIQHCQTWNDPDQLREWWSCQDVEDNFQNGK